MHMIGLTGGIGSGKSTIAKIFATLGIPVFNADQAAKDCMQHNIVIKSKLIENFGPKVFENNQLNRTYLSSIVFNDAYQLSLLNSIVHPITIQAAWDWAIEQNAPYVIKEAALIFETSASEGLDFIIGVTAPANVRMQRVMKRDQLSALEVEKKMNHQISDTIKMRLCDKVIVNDESQLLIPQVLKVHQFILEKIAQ